MENEYLTSCSRSHFGRHLNAMTQLFLAFI